VNYFDAVDTEEQGKFWSRGSASRFEMHGLTRLFRMLEIRVSKFPQGKSVQPMNPAKSVSPTNITPFVCRELSRSVGGNTK
jgi:hypothetical protein